MVGDSSNLVDLVRSHLTGDFSTKISTLLGESRDKTQSGVDAAVPGILSGFERTASTTDGAQRLSNAVDGADDTMFSKIGQIFGKTPSGEGSEGTLHSILGAGGFSELAGNLGRSSGLPAKSITTLLSFLAPIVLGVLKTVKREKGLDTAGLSNLLSSQKTNFAAAMPEGGRDSTTAEGASYEGEPLRDASRRISQPGPVRTYTSPSARESGSRDWIVPLLVVLGLVGLLWYWSSRPSVQAGREQPAVSQQAAPGTTVTLDMLKTKYQSVLNQAQAQGIQITSMENQDGKLVIKGMAPSTEAANKVWDEIKNVNPNMNDIVADFRVAQ